MGTITDKLNKLAETKSAIKTAIVNKGVTVTDTDTFASYADKISSISSGGHEFDFTVLGYNQEECKDANNIANAAINLGDYTQSQITEAIAYGKELYDGGYSITNENVDKDKLLFYPKLELPYVYKDSKVLYIPNVEYSSMGGYVTTNAYTNQLLYKVGNINAEFTNSHYSQEFFSNCYSLREVGDINITGRAINYNNFFNNCYTLRKIGNLNTTGSTNFSNMFYNCSYLTSIPQLDTSSGTSFENMFNNCSSITTIPQIDTSSGTAFSNIFFNCTFDVDGLDFSNAAGQYAYQKPFYYYRGKRVSNIKTTQYSAGFFSGCYQLESATNIDASASTDYSLYSMFQNCSKLKEVSFATSTSNITNFSYMFSSCSSLTSILQLDTSSGTDLSNMFYNCSSLTSIPQLDTSSGTAFNNMFQNCSNLKRIEGISFKSLNKTVTDQYLTGRNFMDQLRYVLIKDIGTCTGMTKIGFVNWYRWGVDDETTPDARQSLIDSLLTYSFDRATAGYSTCTISLHNTQKALLTEDEIAQITSKGYTIA